MTGILQANTSYTVSCWAKLKTSESADLKLRFRFEDSVTDDPRFRTVSSNINNDSWTKVEGQVVFESDGTLTTIDMFATGPEATVEYWVDDFSVVLTAP